MRNKMKTLFFSILCLSMVTGYCLPTFANEESLPQDLNTVVEENGLPEEIEKTESETEKEVEELTTPTDETVESEVPEVEEVVPVEEEVVVETAPVQDQANMNVDSRKTEVFTVIYVLRQAYPNAGLEHTKRIQKTFTSEDFPEYDDDKMNPELGSIDSSYFNTFVNFVDTYSPEGYWTHPLHPGLGRVSKDLYIFYLDKSVSAIPIKLIYVDENGNKVFEGGQGFELDAEVTKLSSDLISQVPNGYELVGKEFDIQTDEDGEKYVNAVVRKMAEDTRNLVVRFFEESGDGYKLVNEEVLKLSEVMKEDELGSREVYVDSIRSLIKVGYVLENEPQHGIIFGESSGNATITAKPVVELIVKKVYSTDDITGPSVNDDLDIPTVGITLTPEVKAILEDSIVDETVKENIKKAIADGKKVTIKVDYNAKDVNKTETDLVASFMQEKGYNFVQYFDLGISVVTDSGEVLGEITETVKPLAFNFSIPETLKKDGRKFHVMRVHNGAVSELDVTENAFYTFTTNQFSTYAIGYTDGNQTGTGQTNSDTKPESKPENKEESKKDNSVNTATKTNSTGFMTVMMMSLAVLLVIVGIKKLESSR